MLHSAFFVPFSVFSDILAYITKSHEPLQAKPWGMLNPRVLRFSETSSWHTILICPTVRQGKFLTKRL